MAEGELWFVRLREFTSLAQCMIDEVRGNVVRLISVDSSHAVDGYYEIGKDVELVQRIEDAT